MKLTLKHYLALLVPIVFLLAYQNCGPSFNANSVQGEGLSLGAPNNPDNLPAGPGVDLPQRTVLETRVYLGATGPFVQPLRIDHQTDTVTKLPQMAVPAQGVGWINFDPLGKYLIVTDAGNTAVSARLQYSSETGSLSLAGGFNVSGSGVHGTLIEGIANTFLYLSSYGAGQLSSYMLSKNLDFMALAAPVISFGNNAKTHSSAYDSKRQLLFVANLGLDQIKILKVNLTSGVLEEVGTKIVTSPRTVIYDAVYDKLYLATEASMGNSYIYGYSITAGGNGLVELNEVASETMPLIGADIKVDHTHRYVLATARESGMQSVHGMALTSTGLRDTTRPTFKFDVNRVQPRSLEVSADGKYVVVAMNSATTDNIQVYKMNYDVNRRFVSATSIYTDLVGDGFLSSLSVPLFAPEPAAAAE